jgi:hypothetical protein
MSRAYVVSRSWAKADAAFHGMFRNTPRSVLVDVMGR